LPPPRADFACLGKKCRTLDGEAAVYELPIGATACPICRSRRIQRLYNSAPGMIRSGMRAVQHHTDLAGAEAELVRHNAQDAEVRRRREEVAPTLAVPIAQVLPMLSGAQLGKGAPGDRAGGVMGQIGPPAAQVTHTPVPSDRIKVHRDRNGNFTGAELAPGAHE